MKNNFDPKSLNDKGLNLQAIFDIDDLPADMLIALNKSVSNLSDYNQLIVIGHGGATLWNSIPTHYFEGENPIDDFSFDMVKLFLETN